MTKVVVALKDFRAIRERAKTGLGIWDETERKLADHQAEAMRPLQKNTALLEFTDVLRKAMRGIQELSDHQELAAIVAKVLGEVK